MQKMILGFFAALTFATVVQAHPAPQPSPDPDPSPATFCLHRSWVGSLFVTSAQSMGITGSHGAYTVAAQSCYDLESARKITVEGTNGNFCVGNRIITDLEECTVDDIQPL